jgi:hypothetical protein
MTWDIGRFRASLADETPPQGVSRALAALWYAGKGHWQKAHELAQEQDDQAGAWVHAYLHRVEGDQDNAGYWYRRAGRPHASVPTDQEWEAIAQALFADSAAKR